MIRWTRKGSKPRRPRKYSTTNLFWTLLAFFGIGVAAGADALYKDGHSTGPINAGGDPMKPHL